jgi:hypothetical protein
MTAVSTEPNHTVLAKIDKALAGHRPFGSTDYISQCFQTVYKRRLIKISDAMPVAGRIVELLDRVDPRIADRVLSDTCVRITIEHLRRAAVTGRSGGHRLAPQDMSESLLNATADYLAGGRGPSPLNLSRTPRLGDAAHHPWIWSDDRPHDDPFGAYFRWLLEAIYGGMPRTVSEREVEALRRGARLLEDLLPFSSHSVLGRTQTVSIIPAAGVWKKMQSSSQYLLGGTIFLSELILDRPWLVAELLYHESIHQKLYDFRHGHTLLNEDTVLDPDSLSASDVLIQSPWNYPDNEWDTHRVLAAFHVYVHVSTLCLAADERATDLEPIYGPRVGMTSTRDAIERARYLGEKLKEAPCWGELGSAGQFLVEWLTSILDGIDASPVPRGSYLHLLLNRYEKEAERVRGSGQLSEVSYQAQILANDEPVMILDLLEKMHREDIAGRLRSAIGELSTLDHNERFAQGRHLIMRALRECSPDGYSLPSPPSLGTDPNRVVARIIERSSRLLAVGQQINDLDGPSAHDLLIGRH